MVPWDPRSTRNDGGSDLKCVAFFIQDLKTIFAQFACKTVERAGLQVKKHHHFTACDDQKQS